MAKDGASGADGGKDSAPVSRKKWFIDNLLSLGLALLVVFAIRSSVFESFKIPTGSMVPTLAVGHYLFGNKFAYGFKVPFTDLLLEKPLIVIPRETPKRGDIFVFRYPRDESTFFIKRVIGVPGDTIQLKDKVLVINGKPLVYEPIP